MGKTKFSFHLVRFGVLLGLVAFAFVQFNLSHYGPTVEKVHAANVSIHLLGSIAAWNSSTTNPNPTITVKQGDTVTLSLSSADGAPHRFILDMDKDGAGDTADCTTVDPCSASFPPDTSFSFTAGTSGTYTYYCIIHPTSMFGTFAIQAPAGNGDFSLTISPTTLTIALGASGQFNVAVQSLNSFSGNVNIATSIAPNSPTISATPTSVTLSPGGTGNSTVTVSTSSGGLYGTPTPNGAYTVTVTGTSGAITHTQTATANVGTSTSNPPSNNSTDPVLLDAGIAVAVLIAIIIGGTIYFRRRRK